MNQMQEYKETQRLLDEGVVGNLPEKISNRMLKRLVRFAFVWVVGLGRLRACTDKGLTSHPTPFRSTNQPTMNDTRQIPFISMPLLGAVAMFGFYIYLAKNTDVRTTVSLD